MQLHIRCHQRPSSVKGRSGRIGFLTSESIITHGTPVGTPLSAFDTRAGGEVPATHESTATAPVLLCEVCDQRKPRLGVVRPVPLKTVVCGPCWAQHGGDASASEIGPAPQLTVGVREPDSQGEWLRCLEAEEWVQRLRRDVRRRLLKLAQCLRNWADWAEFTCRPTWPVLCAASEWARSTMAAWLRQLRLCGWLTIVEPGSTPEHRPMGSPSTAEGNRAAVYALRVPMTAEDARPGQNIELVQILPQEPIESAGNDPSSTATSPQVSAPVGKTWTPSWSFKSCKEGFVGTSTRARDFFHSSPTPETLGHHQMEALRARSEEEQRLTFADRVPVSDAEMYGAACELRHQHPILARLSPRAIRSLARPYWRAGWSNDDMLHGLTWRPTSWSTSLPSPTEYAVIHPLGWCRSRLTAWRDDRNRILPGRSQRAAQRDADQRRRTAQYGQIGARLLGRNPAKPLVEHVASFGRRCAEQLAATQAAEHRRADEAPTPRAMAASEQTRAAERERFRTHRRHAELNERLLNRARTTEAERQEQSAAETTWTPSRPATTAERYELAIERARSEGRRPPARRHRFR